ncbi:uncharacterized protein O3C94_008248 isoform 1-T1 [Discoglossus pictus]
MKIFVFSLLLVASVYSHDSPDHDLSTPDLAETIRCVTTSLKDDVAGLLKKLHNEFCNYLEDKNNPESLMAVYGNVKNILDSAKCEVPDLSKYFESTDESEQKKAVDLANLVLSGILDNCLLPKSVLEAICTVSKNLQTCFDKISKEALPKVIAALKKIACKKDTSSETIPELFEKLAPMACDIGEENAHILENILNKKDIQRAAIILRKTVGNLLNDLKLKGVIDNLPCKVGVWGIFEE